MSRQTQVRRSFPAHLAVRRGLAFRGCLAPRRYSASWPSHGRARGHDMKEKAGGRAVSVTLQRLRVDGFKAVKSSGYIDLEPLTLLIGRNGSGKSSLVEALQWLQDAYFDGLLKATEERFRAFSYLLNKRSRSIRLHLELSSTRQPLYYDLEVKRAVVGDRPIVVDETVREGQTRAQKKLVWTTKGGRGPVYRNAAGTNPEKNANRLALESMSESSAALRSLATFIERMVVLRLRSE